MLESIKRDLKATFSEYLEFHKNTRQKSIVRNLKAETFADEVYSFMRTPRQLERYYLTWICFALYSSVKFILLLPLDMVRVVISFIVGSRGYSFKSSTWSSIIVVASLAVFTSDLKIFDMSYLYHTFRGQSSLKFYGLLFAFEISEKLLTLIGKKVYTALDSQTRESRNILRFWKEIVCSLSYTLVHTMSIYLEYTVFIVILNSAMGSFTIYFFVMNLTKMKSTAFKKFDDRSYAAQINYDMKDRMNKLLYIVFFVCSQSIRKVDLLFLKLFFIINVGTLIEWVKHLTILNLTDRSPDIDKIRAEAIATAGDDKRVGLMKCLSFDYTMLPMITFVLKMAMTINDPKNTSSDVPNLLSGIGVMLAELLLFPGLYLLYRLFRALGSND